MDIKKEHEESREKLGVSLYTLVSLINTSSDPTQGEAALYLLLSTIASLVFVKHDEELLKKFFNDALYLLGNI